MSCTVEPLWTKVKRTSFMIQVWVCMPVNFIFPIFGHFLSFDFNMYHCNFFKASSFSFRFLSHCTRRFCYFRLVWISSHLIIASLFSANACWRCGFNVNLHSMYCSNLIKKFHSHQRMVDARTLLVFTVAIEVQCSNAINVVNSQLSTEADNCNH